MQNQINKQKEQKLLLEPLSSFNVPDVLEEGTLNEGLYFKMPYIIGSDYAHKFGNLSKHEIDNLFEKMVSLIEFYISISEIQTIGNEKFLDKCQSIKLACNLPILDKVLEYVGKISEIVLPIGYCHGDLALANIIESNDQLYLIDFLDSFIETPLQDIAKLRQDSKHKWLINLFDSKNIEISNKSQLIINLNYFDSLIDSYFQKYEWYTYYKLFQIVNLSRILPYTSNDNTIVFIETELKKLIGTI